MPQITRFLPRIDPDSKPYWDSARAHAATLQKCDNCGKFRFYPSPACHFCGSLEFKWEPISGKGEIYSYSILERAKGNSFADLVPIALVMVTLDEGPVMVSDLVNYEPGSVHIGQRVEMTYQDITDEITLPMFQPAVDAG